MLKSTNSLFSFKSRKGLSSISQSLTDMGACNLFCAVQVSESLRRFEKSLIIALKEKGWDGKENEETVGSCRSP